MNGEYLIDWACGYYDEFQQKLYDGEITLEELKQAYKEKRITEYQYNFGLEYLEK